MANTLTVHEFFKRFPDDEACLDHLMERRYGKTIECPKCKKTGTFKKLSKHPAYSCPWCGHHIHPMRNTIFADSHTPLNKWFYAIYLFTTTRHGVPAKELQRQLGVSYPTAFRMAHLIRKHMGMVDGNPPLGGHVEADETYVGGKQKGVGSGSLDNKTVVFGLLERDGDVLTHVVPNARAATLEPEIKRHVEKGTIISTDENKAYTHLRKMGYRHGRVNHSRFQYVNGPFHVNSLEGYWSMLKRSIRGTHVHVSAKWMASYLGEFEFRYNLRHSPAVMFDRLVMRL